MSQRKYIIFQKEMRYSSDSTFTWNTKIIQYLWYNLYLWKSFSIVCHRLNYFTRQKYLWRKSTEKERHWERERGREWDRERDKEWDREGKPVKNMAKLFQQDVLDCSDKNHEISTQLFSRHCVFVLSFWTKCILVNFIRYLHFTFAMQNLHIKKNIKFFPSCSLFTWSVMSIFWTKMRIIFTIVFFMKDLILLRTT